MVSRRQRFFNGFARLVSKPMLAAIRPLWLLRAMIEVGAPWVFKAPKGLRTERIAPRLYRISTAQTQPGKGTMLYIHGGGFVAGGLRSYRQLVGHLADAAGMTGAFVSYRLAPEHPYPAALDDVETAYRRLLDDPSTGPIVCVGDSAGGHLLFALLLRLKGRGMPGPKASVALCPATDLRGQNPSLLANARTERVLPENLVRLGAAAYLGDADPSRPELSPVLGDFRGGGPVMIDTDQGEILHDDARLMADKLRADGVDVTLHIAQHLFHVWHINAGRSPEADAAIARIGAFLREHSTGSSENSRIFDGKPRFPSPAS